MLSASSPPPSRRRSEPPLERQVVWITGASSGLGEALAVRLSREGARLVLSGRDRERLERVRARCPGEAAIVPLELARSASLPERAEAAIAAFGRVDTLINNAGIAVRDWALDIRPEVDRALMEVNYFGAVALTKAVLPHMLERGSGRIVAITSVSGKYGIPKGSAYAASKHALHGFFDSLRLELQGSGVGVTLIVPGLVRTPILRHAVRGDGSPYGRSELGQSVGIAPEACAAEIVRALRAGRDEATVGLLRDELTVLYRRLFPRSFYRFLGHHPIKRLQRVRTRLSPVRLRARVRRPGAGSRERRG